MKPMDGDIEYQRVKEQRDGDEKSPNGNQNEEVNNTSKLSGKKKMSNDDGEMEKQTTMTPSTITTTMRRR